MTKRFIPPNPNSPENIPHYPEWPYAPHADWPHGRSPRMFNDSEPAHVRPHPVDCCHPDDSECVCVTSGDMAVWNSYSGLSGLTAFDPAEISAIFDKVQGMDDYSAVADGYYTVSAYSAIWDSAAYVPNIYENISALFDDMSTKADYSAISAYCDTGVYPDGTRGDGALRVWTDSIKDYYHGDRVPHDGTIVGDGSFDRPLRVGQEIVTAAMVVNSAVEKGHGIVTHDDLEKTDKNVTTIAGRQNGISAEVTKLREIVDILADGNAEATKRPTFIYSDPGDIVERSTGDTYNFYYSFNV